MSVSPVGAAVPGRQQAHLRGQLRRVEHVEVDAPHREVPGERRGVVGPDVDEAGPVGLGGHGDGGRGRGRRRRRAARAAAPARGRPRWRHRSRRRRSRRCPRCRPRSEPRAVRHAQRQTVDAERAPVLARGVPADEVPAAGAVDQPVGLDVAPGRSVVEAEPERGAAGLGDRLQRRGLDGRRRALRERGRRREHVDAVPQARRQHLLELDERGDGGLLDALRPRPSSRARGRPRPRPPRRRREAGEEGRGRRRACSRPTSPAARGPGSPARAGRRRRCAPSAWRSRGAPRARVRRAGRAPAGSTAAAAAGPTW